MTLTYDYIVLGGGSAGYAAARTARQYCERVAIVDGAPELGGLCILRGCMPSKTLIYAAEVLHHARHGSTYGLDIPHASADMAAVQARKQKIIAEFADYRSEQLQSKRFSLYRSRGKLTSPDTVELDDGTRLCAPKIFIATGSVVAQPPLPGLDKVKFLTSDEILALDVLPASVLVLGGGIVACELAQYLHRMGSKITIIQRSPHILKEMSPEAAAVVENAFRKEGIDLYTDTQISQISDDENGIHVSFEHNSIMHGEATTRRLTRSAQYLFNALGRTPATQGIGLEDLGLQIKPSGHIVCNEFQETSIPGIYAGGDCAGPHEIVHIAIRQGETAAAHAFGKTVKPLNYDHLMGVVFTDPQIAQVGLGEKQLQARGIDYVAESYPFDDHGKSILMEARHGYVKILAEKPGGKILGAECVGKDAGELIHALTVPVSLGLTVQQCLQADWYHPTLSEIWTYPLEDIADALAFNL